MGASWIRVEATQVVSKVPCQVGAVVVSFTSSGPSIYALLYDGESASDPLMLTVRTGAGETREVIFPVPMVCHRGLYVVLTSHCDECLIQYEPLKV